MLIWLIWKIEILSEELVDRLQTVLYQPGGGGCQLLVIPTHFYVNNFLLKLLLISLHFN